MKITRAALLSACALFAALAPGVNFAATAARGMLAPVEGEVIVRFKAGATTMRAHVLAARAGADTVQTVLGQRASTLGARVGVALTAGASAGERTQVVRASGMSTADLIARLQADPDVEYVVPNGRVHRSTAPNDPLYAAGLAINTSAGTGGPVVGQWYLRAPTGTVSATGVVQPAGAVVSSLDIEAAWAKTSGKAGIVVAVLDTGVRPEHPDLAGRLLPGYDFVSDCLIANDQNSLTCNPTAGLNPNSRDADPTDPGDWITAAENRSGTFAGCGTSGSSWHGTATASLVGAATNNGVGMAGAAPGVSLLPIRVIGKCGGEQADIIAAMRWAVGLHVDGVPDNTDHKARVLNMSLGGCTASGNCTCDAAYQSAVNEVLAQGAVIVVAAGNSDGGPVEAPASCAGVIAVAAVRHVGTKVGFSSLGPEVAISAPGGNCVISTGACLYPIIAATNTGATVAAASSWFDSYRFEYGTSFSAPLVAGVAGLMFSAAPTLTPAQVRSLLMSTSSTFPSTGGTAGTLACHAPTSAVQDECYCTTTTCGAGMLNAGAAVTAAAATVTTPVAHIVVTTTSPTAGSAVTLSATTSTGGSGSVITVYKWTLADGGGIVTAFTSADNASTATLTPTAAGTFKVTLAVTDGNMETALAEQTVTVAAAPVVVTPPAASGGGGGGATSVPWLALLALATAALFRARPRRA